MTEAAKAARAAYRRKWNAANKDRIKAYHERYWEKKAAQAEAAQEPEQIPGQIRMIPAK